MRVVIRVAAWVLIFLENHTFDNLYGKFPGADGLDRPGARIPQVDRQGRLYAVLPRVAINVDYYDLPWPLSRIPPFADLRFPRKPPNAPFLIDAYASTDQFMQTPVHRFYHFVDFFRGCIDGDGSIVTYIDHYNTFKKPQYVYRRLYVSIVSASLRFVDWLQATVRRLVGIAGELTVRRVQTRNDLWRLRYAKGESVALLRWMYYSPNVPCLHRKRATAAAFLVPNEQPRRRGPGRPMVV